MIVVSNTSPLTNLAAIQQFELLQRLYQEIHIPQAVWNELNAQQRPWPGCREVANADWIYHHRVTNVQLVKALTRDLDLGEAESIGLALELKADMILLDETDGRRVAQRWGLKTVGVLGILTEAKTKQLIDEMKPLLQSLRYQIGFYLSPRLYQEVLQSVGEGD
jgi:uncharacterized protein